MTTILQNPIFQDRVKNISPKYGDLRDDIAQHINVTIFELEQTDRNFARQEIGYKITRAKWIAQDYIKRNVTLYDRFIQDAPEVIGDEGEEANFFDEFVSSGESVESEVIEEERSRIIESAFESAIESLPKEQREIAYLLMRGYNNRAIANKLGRGDWMIGHIIKKMSQNSELAAIWEGIR